MAERTILALLLALAAPAGARAQYLFTGSGSTVEGDYLRGMGIAAYGIGQGNLATAQADSIYTDTWIRLNEYISASIERENHLNFLHRKAQSERRRREYEEIRQRILHSPEARDVDKGDALNAVLKEMNSGLIPESVHRSTEVPLTVDEVRKIPFKLAQVGMQGFSMRRLVLKRKGTWPPAFQDRRFEGVVRRYQDALDLVLEQEVNGAMQIDAMDKLKVAVQALAEELELAFKNRPNDRMNIEASAMVRSLQQTTESLKTHKLQMALHDLDQYSGATINDLRIFMRKHGLEFADSQPGEERGFYPELYARLRSHYDMVKAGLDAHPN